MECLTAEKVARMNANELQVHAPINLQFSAADDELANYVGNHIYTVYNDAKRGTLSAFSWPSRVVACDIGSKTVSKTGEESLYFLGFDR